METGEEKFGPIFEIFNNLNGTNIRVARVKYKSVSFTRFHTDRDLILLERRKYKFTETKIEDFNFFHFWKKRMNGLKWM